MNVIIINEDVSGSRVTRNVWIICVMFYTFRALASSTAHEVKNALFSHAASS